MHAPVRSVSPRWRLIDMLTPRKTWRWLLIADNTDTWMAIARWKEGAWCEQLGPIDFEASYWAELPDFPGDVEIDVLAGVITS